MLAGFQTTIPKYMNGSTTAICSENRILKLENRIKIVFPIKIINLTVLKVLRNELKHLDHDKCEIICSSLIFLNNV